MGWGLPLILKKVFTFHENLGWGWNFLKSFHRGPANVFSDSVIVDPNRQVPIVIVDLKSNHWFIHVNWPKFTHIGLEIGNNFAVFLVCLDEISSVSDQYIHLFGEKSFWIWLMTLNFQFWILPRFFPRCIGDEKERQFPNWKICRLNGIVVLPLGKFENDLKLIQ